MQKQFYKIKKIFIYQSKFENLRDDEEYLRKKAEKFRILIRKINDYRKDKHLKLIEKDDYKIDHDIFLREAILSSREKSTESLNDSKIFGLTLDKLLLKYDKSEIEKLRTSSFTPSFFSTSFFLEKIKKFVPVVTDDYERAFICAISSQGFDSQNKNSVVVQKSVKYFHNMGIENENLILHCIKDEIFLEEFNKKEGTNELGIFVESEVDSYIKQLEKDKNNLSSSLNTIENKLRSKEESVSTKEQEIDKISSIIKEKEDIIGIYKKELDKLRTKSEYPIQHIKQQLDLKYEEKDSGEKDYNKENIIDWTLLIIRIKQCLKFKYVLLSIDILLFLLIVLSGIVSKIYIEEFLAVSAVGFAIFSGFWLKTKKIIYCGVLLFILIIYSFFILFNFTYLWNIWTNLLF